MMKASEQAGKAETKAKVYCDCGGAGYGALYVSLIAWKRELRFLSTMKL